MNSASASVAITSVKSLEAKVGKTPGPRNLKVIDFLDEHALGWISASPCLFVSVASNKGHGVQAIIGGGAPGFAKGSTQELVIPLESLDNTDDVNVGDGWGSLFLIPTYKESLRVNGRVTAVSNSTITVAITECYLHCAKAFMRSKFWVEYETPPALDEPSQFSEQARFMLVATSDDQLGADISPKGDPAGQLLQFSDGCFWHPDRPGNRRVDGFRNILTRPTVDILVLRAGSSQVLRITGSVNLYSEHPMKQNFHVNNKPPVLLVKIIPNEVALEESTALKRAKLWPPSPPEQLFKAAKIWQAHMKLSKLKGVEARLAKTAISLPGALEAALDWDYKNNLY